MTAAGFLLLYQATVIDSRSAGAHLIRVPLAGTTMDFTATAYCKGATTASGISVKSGVAAANPHMLPEGSVVQVNGVPPDHEGIYTVLDTGPKVQGRHLDLYMWSCNEALEFGRRPVSLTVLRLGWDPKNSAPSLGDDDR